MHADFSTTVITYGWCNPTKANKTVLTKIHNKYGALDDDDLEH